MKTIGIVGGLAWPSTITYYKLINEEIAKRLGGDGLHCASLLLAQTDFEQIAHAQARGDWQRVGALLAGQANRLKAAGADFDNIHNALYQELVKDVFLPETREKFRAAIRDLTDRGAQAVILGCTEFGLLVKPEDCAVPLIDTTYAHAMAAVDRALA